MEPVKLYSANQTAIAALIAGPVPIAYIVYQNFMALDKQDKAEQALKLGALLIFALFTFYTIIPAAFFPPFVKRIIIAMIGYFIIQSEMPNKGVVVASDLYVPRSNWVVLLVSFLSFVVNFILTFMVAKCLSWLSWGGDILSGIF